MIVGKLKRDYFVFGVASYTKPLTVRRKGSQPKVRPGPRRSERGLLIELNQNVSMRDKGMHGLRKEKEHAEGPYKGHG